jgi:hypothetical protein
MTRASLALLLLAGSLSFACNENGATPTSPTGTQPETAPATTNPPTSTELTLAPGQRVPVTGTSLSLQFIGVASDSRCPADAFCVQLGEAVAAFDGSLAQQSGTPFELRTSDAGRTGHVGTYKVELVSLLPYPFGSKPPIDPAEYRATVKVTAQ